MRTGHTPPEPPLQQKEETETEDVSGNWMRLPGRMAAFSL
jgi:hypothetical protein